MEKSRTLEILKMVSTELETDGDKSRGICYYIESVYGSDKITNDEFCDFHRWFSRQKPKKGKNFEFTKAESFTGSLWWWRKDIWGYNQRVLFLDHLISKFDKALNKTI